MKRTILFVIIGLIQLTVYALPPESRVPYYGSNFQGVHTQLKDDDLIQELHKIVKNAHIKTEEGADKIVPSCSVEAGECAKHTAYGYDRARKFLFGKFYLVQTNNEGGNGIKEMYCDRVYIGNDFNKGPRPGTNVIPDHTVINVEHTWPQSKFSGLYPKDLQKSDLHHLFPTDSSLNSLRGNNMFGEVEVDEKQTKCGVSRYGYGSGGTQRVFEPPDSHKGVVARALFYFSVRYEISIPEAEERILKMWNNEFPVDDEEMTRNNEIEKVQMNRNPFIDYPELANQIADF